MQNLSKKKSLKILRRKRFLNTPKKRLKSLMQLCSYLRKWQIAFTIRHCYLLKPKDYSGASDALLQALEIIPDDGPMNYEYAQLLLNSEDTKGARHHLERAVAAAS